MRGINIARLARISYTQRPLVQRVLAYGGLWPNFEWFPGVEIIFEGDIDPSLGPVILAVNHTDRYGYFPLAYKWWKDFDRYFVAWAKGKYFENQLLGYAIEKLGGIPTVSRGYLVTRDFVDFSGRPPDEGQYRHLREWVDGEGLGEAPSSLDFPSGLLTSGRNILGRDFNPSRENYAQAICALYARMMERFVELHGICFAAGRDLMIFPEGTRSVRLGVLRQGIAQLALHFKVPVIPVGCNGSDAIYPGACPLARGGRVVYRFGAPLMPEELGDIAPTERFLPFTAEAEKRYAVNFATVTELIRERLNALLDHKYRFDPAAEPPGEAGVKRFL